MFDIVNPMRTGSFRETTAKLGSAIDEIHDVAFSTLTDEERSELLLEIDLLTARLKAARVNLVDEAEHVDLARLTNQRNVANHVASLSNSDPAPLRAEALVGRWLRDFPVLREAFEAGVIRFGHVDLLRKADNERVHHQMFDDQEGFVSWFREVAFRDVPQLITRWLLGADPDGQAPDEQQKTTGLSLTPLPNGGLRVSGILDPLQGSAVRDAVNHEEQQIRRRHNEADITSTVRQRTLEALLNLLGRGSARPDGAMPLPRVNIVMSQKVYEDTAEWLEDPAAPFPDIDPAGKNIDRLSQLIDGTPIHPMYGFAAATIGVMRRLVYSAKGRPIDVSTNARKIPKWMLEAQLIKTNGKCSNPVCDAPLSWLHADHIEPHSHGQNTSLDNSQPLCEADNLWKGSDPTRGQQWTPQQPERDESRPSASSPDKDEPDDQSMTSGGSEDSTG